MLSYNVLNRSLKCISSPFLTLSTSVRFDKPSGASLLLHLAPAVSICTHVLADPHGPNRNHGAFPMRDLSIPSAFWLLEGDTVASLLQVKFDIVLIQGGSHAKDEGEVVLIARAEGFAGVKGKSVVFVIVGLRLGISSAFGQHATVVVIVAPRDRGEEKDR